MPRSRIALETGTHSPWISRLLSESGHEVIVANARKVRLIGESRQKDDRLDGVDIVIGCVDTREARAAIAKCSEEWSEVDYWLDLGNNADSGQFVLGEPLNRRNRRHRLRLRTVSELFPEAIRAELDRDDLPSCSAEEALDRQEPFVNPTLANHALALFARLFRYGTLSHHGAFVSLSSSCVQALRVDPKSWQRLRRKVSRQETPRPAQVHRPSFQRKGSGLITPRRKIKSGLSA